MKFGVVLFLLGFVSSSVGQVLPDSVILKKSKEYALTAYDRAMEGNLHIYSGSEYVAYLPLKNEHPFFMTPDWTSGDILYDGEWFNNVPMLFDIEKGVVVISYYFKGIKMQLNSERVLEFIFNGHQFINLKQTNDTVQMSRGFYDVLYNGKTTVLAKRTKKYFESISGTDLTQGFKETSQLFLYALGDFHKVSSKSGVISLMSDKKKEVKQYIRQNKLFVTDRETSVARTAQYYDSLKP